MTFPPKAKPSISHKSTPVQHSTQPQIQVPQVLLLRPKFFSATNSHPIPPPPLVRMKHFLNCLHAFIRMRLQPLKKDSHLPLPPFVHFKPPHPRLGLLKVLSNQVSNQ